jgi:hypothetical protein
VVKKKAPKFIRVRIIPLALLKKRLAAAHLATTDFEDAQKAKGRSADKGTRAKLIAAETYARGQVSKSQRSARKP